MADIISTYSERVAGTNNDGNELAGTWSNSSSYLGDSGGNDYTTGLRWSSVEIPQGSIITNAYVTITWLGSYDGTGTITVPVYGADADSTSEWGSGNKPSDQTPTTATTTFSFSSDYSNNTTTNFDVTPIIQEIISRGGWTSGSSLSLMLQSTATSNRRESFYDVNNDGNKSALLTVEYIDPADMTDQIEHCVDGDTVALWHMNGVVGNKSLDLEAGSSQYAYITDAGQTGLDLNSACSFEAWIKPESLPSSTNKQIILAKENTTSAGRAYELAIYNNAGTYQLLVGIGIADATNMGFRGANFTFAVDTWYHVAATYLESSNTTFLYVNGVQIGTGTIDATGTLPNTDGNFTIGARCNTAQDFFDGLLDDVRVWDDVRSAAEILANYQAELTGSEANLVGYWKFNNDYQDSTSNNNELTAGGSPVFSTISVLGKTGELANRLALTEVNTPTAATGFDGTANGAYTFNGTNEYLSVADNAVMDFGTADFTAECWFKTARNSEQTNSGMIAFGKIKETSTYEGYWLYMNMSATAGDRGKVAFQVRTTSGGFVGGSTTTQYNDDAWHYAVGVRTGSNIYLYIDGVLQVTTTGGNINVDNTGPLYIGTNGSAAGTNDNWDGSIDEVMLSNRAKSAEEIAKYYSGTVSAKFYPVAGDAVIIGSASTTFSTIHDATTGTLNAAAGEGYSLCRFNSPNYNIYRTFQNFNTAVIPDTATISLVTSSVYSIANSNPTGNHHGVYGSTAQDTVVADDFNNSDTTAYSDSPFLDTDFVINNYHTITWNATGRAAISKTGITKICYKEVEHDAGNSAPSVNQFINFYNSAQTGTATDPYLWIEYTVATATTNTSNFFNFI